MPDELCLINYAKSQLDRVIMAVNTFVKDPNPVIRYLAVRTIGCIRVDKITCESLRKDEDPYVRKTAAVSVAKLHDINATLVEEQVRLNLVSTCEGT